MELRESNNMHSDNEASKLDRDDLNSLINKAISDIAEVRSAITEVIIGQDSVVEQSLITLFAGGHGLIVGLPGLAKTKLVETLGITLGLAQRRIQFTPDLLPLDIIGSEVLEEQPTGARSFRFIKGPIFGQLIMADEINRASPRTQSALLQAMQEHHVTVSGAHYDLPKPFHVFATQNPLEQEGTYPLPEAQLDRFLMQINVDFPDKESERQILLTTTGATLKRPRQALTQTRFLEIQALVRNMPVGDNIIDTIIDLVRSARPSKTSKGDENKISWGPGPRASQAFMLATRARALYHGRLSPTKDDVFALAHPIMRHRIELTFSARHESSVESLLSQLLQKVS